MSWLDDIAAERRRKHANEQTAQDEKAARLAAQFERVSTLVTGLLEDVGRAYWSSVGVDVWEVKAYPGEGQWTAEIRHERGAQCFEVNLVANSRGWFFWVRAAGEASFSTDDLSAASLQGALRQAAQVGPQVYQW